MNIAIETENDCCKNVKAEYTPVEWLIVNKALRLLSGNDKVHKEDRQIASKMINTEPLFCER